MDPISKTDLAALRAQTKIDEKNKYIARIVKDVYTVVTAQARDTDGKHVQWFFARFSNSAEFPTLNDEVVAQVQTLFPGCDIKYVLPADHGDSNAPHSITVDWH